MSGRISLAVPRGNLTIKAALIEGPEALVTVVASGSGSAPVEIVLAQAEINRTRK